MLRKFLFLAAAAGLSTGCISTASAAVQCGIVGSDPNKGAYSCFIGSEDGDELKAFADKRTATPSQFFMSVGTNDDSLKDIVVNTIQNVTVDSGYGEIKPDKNNVLTSASFTVTATSSLQVDGMFFRGQFDDTNASAFNGILFANVIAADGNLTQFEWTGLPTNADHILLGIDEPSLSNGKLLGTVDLFVQAGEMKSLKQIDFSVPGATPPIPEPAKWSMMLLGLAGLGFAGYRKARTRRALAV